MLQLNSSSCNSAELLQVQSIERQSIVIREQKGSEQTILHELSTRTPNLPNDYGAEWVSVEPEVISDESAGQSDDVCDHVVPLIHCQYPTIGRLVSVAQYEHDRFHCRPSHKDRQRRDIYTRIDLQLSNYSICAYGLKPPPTKMRTQWSFCVELGS